MSIDLVLIAGAEPVTREIANGAVLIVGRGNQAGLQFFGRGRLSAVHSRFSVDALGNTEVSDLRSANGTFVNGHRITVHTRLFDGDQVGLAGMLVFEVRGAPRRACPVCRSDVSRAQLIRTDTERLPLYACDGCLSIVRGEPAGPSIEMAGAVVHALLSRLELAMRDGETGGLLERISHDYPAWMRDVPAVARQLPRAPVS